MTIFLGIFWESDLRPTIITLLYFTFCTSTRSKYSFWSHSELIDCCIDFWFLSFINVNSYRFVKNSLFQGFKDLPSPKRSSRWISEFIANDYVFCCFMINSKNFISRVKSQIFQFDWLRAYPRNQQLEKSWVICILTRSARFYSIHDVYIATFSVRNWPKYNTRMLDYSSRSLKVIMNQVVFDTVTLLI